MTRNWIEVGEEFITEAYGSRNATPDHEEVRARIAEQIEGLRWREPKGSLPFTPGMAIQQAVQEFRIPRVSAIAHNGYLRLPDGPETATYAIYGIEGNYADGRQRVYLLDAGGTLVPLATDDMDEQDDETAR